MSKEMIDRDLFYRIVNLATNVHRELGQGLPEHIYKNALASDLIDEDIPYELDKYVDVKYKGRVIDKLKVDILIKNSLIVGVISDDELKKKMKTTMLSTLKLLDNKKGILLNFSHDTLYYKRVVYKTKRGKDLLSAY